MRKEGTPQSILPPVTVHPPTCRSKREGGQVSMWVMSGVWRPPERVRKAGPAPTWLLEGLLLGWALSLRGALGRQQPWGALLTLRQQRGQEARTCDWEREAFSGCTPWPWTSRHSTRSTAGPGACENQGSTVWATDAASNQSHGQAHDLGLQKGGWPWCSSFTRGARSPPGTTGKLWLWCRGKAQSRAVYCPLATWCWPPQGIWSVQTEKCSRHKIHIGIPDLAWKRVVK